MSFLDRVASRFGFERKANPSFMQYANYAQLPQPVQMQANPNAFAKEGYRRNDTVHKCVSYIARNAAGIRLALYTDATKKREIESHPLLDLLAKPNKDMSGNDFIESICAYTLLHGNSYMYALRLAKNGPPDELWSLSPSMIDIVPYPGGILRYDYKVKTPYVPFEPELVGHTKFWNPEVGAPGEDLYGLSPVEVAAILVDQQLAYRKWNLALTQNYAQPPGAWTTPALLGEKERNALEKKVNEKYGGFKNAGKAPVLDGGLDFKSYAVPPAQMAFLEGQQYNSAAIANIYFLAPQIVGDTSASTYDNMEQAKYGSYTEAIFPLMDKVVVGTLNRWLVPMYGKGLFLGYDKESVETIQSVMQAQEGARADRWTKIWLGGGCTLNEYRDKIKLPKVKGNGGNVYRIKDLLIPEDELEAYAEQCLTKPALPPLPVPEGTPDPNNTVDSTLTPVALPAPKPKPGTLPKKSLDANGIYQPDDLEARLAAYEAQGVIATTWKGGTCDTCLKNNGQTRPLGEAFPSGHILPQAHPHCDCVSIPIYAEKRIVPFHPRDEEYRELLRRRA